MIEEDSVYSKLKFRRVTPVEEREEEDYDPVDTYAMRTIIPSQREANSSAIEAGFRSMVDTLTFGLDDEIGAVLRFGAGETWEERRADLERRKNELANAHPYATFFGGLAGGITPTALYSKLGKNVFKKLIKETAEAGTEEAKETITKRVIKDAFGILPEEATFTDIARAGATYGTIHGFGSGDNLGERFTQSGLEGVLGGTLSPLVAKGIMGTTKMMGGVGERLLSGASEFPLVGKYFDPIKQAVYRGVSDLYDQRDYKKAIDDVIANSELFEPKFASRAKTTATVMDFLPAPLKHVLERTLSDESEIRTLLRDVQQNRAPTSIIAKYDVGEETVEGITADLTEKVGKVTYKFKDEIFKDKKEFQGLPEHYWDALDIIPVFENLRKLNRYDLLNEEKFIITLNKDYAAITDELYKAAFNSRKVQRDVMKVLKGLIKDKPIYKEVVKTFKPFMERRDIGENSYAYYHYLSEYLGETKFPQSLQNKEAGELRMLLQQELRHYNRAYNLAQSFYENLKITEERLKLGRDAFMNTNAAKMDEVFKGLREDNLERTAFRIGFHNGMIEALAQAIDDKAFSRISPDYWGKIEMVYGKETKDRIYDWFQFMRQRGFVNSLDEFTAEVPLSVREEFLPYTMRVAAWGAFLNFLTLSPKVDVALSKIALSPIDAKVKLKDGTTVDLGELFKNEVERYKKFRQARKIAGLAAGKEISGRIAENW